MPNTAIIIIFYVCALIFIVKCLTVKKIAPIEIKKKAWWEGDSKQHTEILKAYSEGKIDVIRLEEDLGDLVRVCVSQHGEDSYGFWNNIGCPLIPLSVSTFSLECDCCGVSSVTLNHMKKGYSEYEYLCGKCYGSAHGHSSKTVLPDYYIDRMIEAHKKVIKRRYNHP